MLRHAPVAVAALLLVGQTAPAASDSQASLAVVQGLAEGDLLNLRAMASPSGRVEARLPNGAALKKFGCSTFNGYDWCEVQDIGNPQMRGWVPARYLLDAGPADDAVAAGVTANTQAGRTGGRKLAIPSNLATRFGDAQLPSGDESAAAVRKAVQDAYKSPSTAYEDDVSLLDDGYEYGEADTGVLADEDDAASVPIPTPRPARDGSAGDAGTMAARTGDPTLPATASPTMPGAASDIPCARYVGQPMTRCAVVVARKGDNAADVTVTWPDGGTRIISFRDRKPSGSDAAGAFRFTREGTLNMIRIGPSERFEITDALPFGG